MIPPKKRKRQVVKDETVPATPTPPEHVPVIPAQPAPNAASPAPPLPQAIHDSQPHIVSFSFHVVIMPNKISLWLATNLVQFLV